MTTATTLRAPETAGGPAAELDLVVTSREVAAEDVVVLELAAPDGGPLAAWSPGAHIDLLLDTAAGPLVRHYSLCGDPAERAHWRIAIRRARDGGGGSAHLHDHAHEGAPLRARGPRNRFPLRAAERYLFLAGGIGVTPILPMVRAVAACGADWRLLYTCRSRTRMAFADELAELGGDRVVLHDSGRDGRLDLARLNGALSGAGAIYACGPDALLAELERDPEVAPRLRFERFAAAAAGPSTADLPFEITLARSGGTHLVEPGRSILDVLEDAGVEIDCSCREGTCGTCETEVLEGEPDHRDAVLTPEEQAAGDHMMVCVSRSRSARLVLDL